MLSIHTMLRFCLVCIFASTSGTISLLYQLDKECTKWYSKLYFITCANFNRSTTSTLLHPQHPQHWSISKHVKFLLKTEPNGTYFAHTNTLIYLHIGKCNKCVCICMGPRMDIEIAGANERTSLCEFFGCDCWWRMTMWSW